MTGEAGEPGARDTARRLLGLLRPRRLVLAVALLGIGSIGLNVTGPVVLGAATDVVFDGATGDGVDSGELAVLLCTALALYAGSALCWIAQGRLTTWLVQQLVSRLRRGVDEKLTRLPPAYFDSRSRGEVLSRTTNDVDNVAQSLQQTVSQITNSLLLLVGVVAMMLWISPSLAIVALLAVPLCLYVARAMGRRAQAQFKQQWAIAGELSGHAEETLTAHAVVTVFGRRRQRAEEFRAHSERLRQAAARAQFVSGLMGPLTTLIGNLSYVLVAVVGALQMSAGNLSIGAVQAFVQYSRQFTQPLMSMSSLASVVQSGIASAERVFAFLDAPEEEPGPRRQPGARPGECAQGRVCFEHVGFRYQPDEPLIEDLSLTVEPGTLVAVVGRTGAGKTTLTNLLVRFYDVTSGRITLDGTDIRDLPRDELRSAFGMVPQDTWIFSGTIHDNIAYGKDAATAEEVEAAARLSHADHFIRTLPDGYRTVLDHDGSALSVGERQLITIARAVLADPAILLLDEATSAVDTRTEMLVQQAMARLRHGRTSFVIAHRLSTVRDADLILMMDGGKIIERGTHQELLAARGAYARMHAAQFARTTPEGQRRMAGSPTRRTR